MIAVVGATGWVGSALVEQLARRAPDGPGADPPSGTVGGAGDRGGRRRRRRVARGRVRRGSRRVPHVGAAHRARRAPDAAGASRRGGGRGRRRAPGPVVGRSAAPTATTRSVAGTPRPRRPSSAPACPGRCCARAGSSPTPRTGRASSAPGRRCRWGSPAARPRASTRPTWRPWRRPRSRDRSSFSGTALRLTGPESLTPLDELAILGEVLGRRLRARELADDEVRRAMVRTAGRRRRSSTRSSPAAGRAARARSRSRRWPICSGDRRGGSRTGRATTPPCSPDACSICPEAGRFRGIPRSGRSPSANAFPEHR